VILRWADIDDVVLITRGDQAGCLARVVSRDFWRDKLWLERLDDATSFEMPAFVHVEGPGDGC
jgi:hypothetical protein